MKILVFADTHNKSQPMLDVIGKHEEEVDACIHLGDGLADTVDIPAVFPHIPLHLVQGNCDHARNLPSESLEHFGGVLFFFTHGHAYCVKEELSALWWQAKKRGAQAVLYGHTHIGNYTYRNGLHLFNPGSLTLPRFGPPTYGLITINNNVPFFEICKYEK